MDIGLKSLAEQGTTLPDAVMAAIPEADGVILGPVSHYDYPKGMPNPSAALRTGFALYANIRPCRSRAGLSILRKPMDLVIVRENTEGFYADRSMFMGPGEFMPDENSAFSIRKITALACARVARSAFSLAMGRSRRVTAVHKANVLKLTDGLFLREVRKVAADFPEVTLDEVIVDAAAALLVRSPERFDVIVTTNMFGDILSDEASELSGSLGLGGSINRRRRYLRRAGAAWIGARYPGAGRGQSDLADPVGGDAARLAGAADRGRGAGRMRADGSRQRSRPCWPIRRGGRAMSAGRSGRRRSPMR